MCTAGRWRETANKGTVVLCCDTLPIRGYSHVYELVCNEPRLCNFIKLGPLGTRSQLHALTIQWSSGDSKNIHVYQYKGS